MQYESFPIYNLKEGKLGDKEPWIFPGDAFEILRNCHLCQGVLEKRRGYTEFDRFVHFVNDESIGSSGSKNYTGTLSNTPIRGSDTTGLAFTDGTQTITFDADGSASGGGTGTINYTTGAYNVTFTNTTSGAVTADYRYYPGNPITGLWNCYGTGGISSLLAFDKDRICRYNATDEEFIDITYTTGRDEDDTKDVEIDLGADNTLFWWLQNWEKPKGTFNAYMCNAQSTSVDGTNYGVLYWDGTNLFPLNVDIDGDTNNNLKACRMIFLYKNRLILLDTDEDGTDYHQRARWNEANSPPTTASNWDDATTGAGYIDAPTEDWIISADFIGEDLVVLFERSVWKLVYTGDSTKPFEWERIDTTEGSYATYSTIAFSDEIQTVGPTRIIATDGREVYPVDKRIPDFMLEWNQDSVSYSYGLVIEELRQSIISYASLDATAHSDGNTYPDSAAILNYYDSSWSTYELPIHCLGYWSVESDLIWQNISDKWEDIDWAWGDKELQAGYPYTLLGDHSGYVFRMNYSGNDNGSNIEFEAVTGRWNPYFKQGKKARLGYIDFLVDVGPNVTFDVENYLNTDTASFQTKTVTCDSFDGADERVWKRVYVGATAQFHSIKITNNDTQNRPRIHAIVPWFAPVGGRLV